MQDKAFTRLCEGGDIGIERTIGAAQDISLIQLRRVRGDLYLDGNQYSGSVQTVDSEIVHGSPTFTGVEWRLEAKGNGCWRLLNQGDANYGLLGDRGAARLQPLPRNLQVPDPCGDWLIYWTGVQGEIMMRPVHGAWLTTTPEGNGVMLARGTDVDPKSARWTIKLI